MADITVGERESANTLADQRISNILNAVVGRTPSRDEKESAYRTLEGLFGVNFDDAIGEYIKYQKSNPFVKKIKDIAIRASIGLNKDSYIKNFTNNLGQSNIYAQQHLAEDPSGYNAQLINKLHGMSQQPGFTDQIVSTIMNYRDLNKPIPFVNSSIAYPR